jgi:hypothetical protein
MPPEMRGLEIFLGDSAELSGSAGVANRSGRGSLLRIGRVSFAIYFATIREDLKSDSFVARQGGQAEDAFQQRPHHDAYGHG